ncbi:MAG: hypothetical protein HYU66_02275 [Armatimonadetes bacterium]|nr:hypothetical protein [Armatimonadota bacterium]
MDSDLGASVFWSSRLRDTFPATVPCPYCGASVPAYLSTEQEAADAVPDSLRGAERRCGKCGSRLDPDGVPLGFSPSTLLQEVLTVTVVVLLGSLVLGLAIFLAEIGTDRVWTGGRVALHALWCLAPTVLVVRGLFRAELARGAAREARLARTRSLGGGDPALGERILDCDRRARPLLIQVGTLNRQLAVVMEARAKLAESRFQDRVALYDSAAAVLQRQIDARHSLLDEFAVYRLDLEALAAALRAEQAFKPLDPLADDEALDAERRRLTAEADALEAADEAAQELRALGL